MSLFQEPAPGMVRVNRLWPFTPAGPRSPNASNSATDQPRKPAMNNGFPKIYTADGVAQMLVRQPVKAIMLKELMRRLLGGIFLGLVLSSTAQAGFPAIPAHQGVSAGGAPCAADLATSCQASPPFDGVPFMLLKDTVNWEVLVPQPYITVPQWVICGVSGKGIAAYGSAYCTIPASCPAHATLSGSTCTCDSGYVQNSSADGCTPGGAGGTVVDILRSTKASSCPWCEGNPIYPLVGAKVEPVLTGMSVGGQPLVFTYNSAKQTAAIAAGKTAKTFGNMPALGGLWESSLHRNLVMGTGGFGATLFRGDGHTISFRYSGGAYIADADVNGTFTAISGGYRYVDAKSRSIETYNTAGQLVSWADTAGNTLNFSYSSAAGGSPSVAGYLQKITDNKGRFLRFGYSFPAGGSAATDGLIASVSDSMGRTITTGFDTNGNLKQLTWPDTTTRQFVYENTALPWALTGVIDERGIRYSTFAYDTAGRAVSTEHAGGVDKFSVSYTTPPQVTVTQVYDAGTQLTTRTHEWQAPAGVQLTRPNGQTANASNSNVLGYPLPTGFSQPAGSGYGASNNASTFDVKGNLTSTDDFSGQRTCYAYDSNNRETVRVEGLATTVACASVLPGGSTLPAGSRKTETVWHADWRLPVKVIQPLLVTSTVYQGQPDPFNSNITANCTSAPALPNGKAMPLVCKQVVQATLDNGTPDPAAPGRATVFSYDAAGRLLSSTDASGYYSDTSAGVNGDLNYDKVILLLHGDGANGSTTLVDSSPNPKTVTVVGGARIGTAQSKFGGSSLFFDGVDASDTSITVADSPDFHFPGAYTVEFWVRPSSFKAINTWLFGQILQTGLAPVRIDIAPSTGLVNVLGSSDNTNWLFTTGLTSTTALQIGSWSHVALTDDGTNARLFINGVLQATRATWLKADSATALRIGGGYASGDREFDGYMDDVRVTKGVARYTANFTPPAQAFLNASQTLGPSTIYAYYADTNFGVSGDSNYDKVSLLLHGDGADGSTTIVDSSPNPKAVTVVGGARIGTAQSKFGGSSLFFDGVDASNTAITLADSPDFHFPGAYTVEFWIRPSSFKANAWLFFQANQTTGSVPAPLQINLSPEGLIWIYGSSDNVSWLFTDGFKSPTSLPLATWSHVALADDGTTARLFINGVLQASRATWSKTDSPSLLRIGGSYIAGDREFDGYLDDVRVTKGMARYTANFTPPAQAFASTGPVIDPAATGHTAGDLQSITNPAGHVTQFPLYDGMGRVRRMVDPKGVVTDTDYTPRGWISSTSVTPPGGTTRTTTYTYDNAGQLTGAALPDGTTLGYSYDDAHRLTGVMDAKGNSVTYTLDNMGNRTGEQVKDSSNTLQRNITRVYDALNRVQQVTGASN
jgi:YD repeat-containing protein